MNTQILGIPSTVRRSDDHLIPAPSSVLPLIEQLASSHAAVLLKWKTKFALDLRRIKAAG